MIIICNNINVCNIINSNNINESNNNEIIILLILMK